MRVVNGPSTCSGTVQIFHDGNWATVCDAGWDVTEAQVACRELRCPGNVLAKQNSYFGLPVPQSWMASVSCTGRENSLTECTSGFVDDLCDPANYAGVICESKYFLLHLYNCIFSDT